MNSTLPVPVAEPRLIFQIRLVLLTVLCAVVDGFDIQAIAFAGPVILQEWGITRSALGPAIGAALVGMALGAPFGGTLGDRMGRRNAILLSVATFGAGTLLAAATSSIEGLASARFLSGIGFGALLPNATALLAEWMPARRRSLAIGLVIIGVPIGGMIGAAVASWVIPTYGWRACFLIGGAAAIGILIVLAVGLPESLMFLVRRGTRHDRVENLKRTAYGSQAAIVSAGLEDDEEKAPWTAILAGRHVRATIGLGLAFFANLLIAYAFFSWAPILLTSAGLSLPDALRGAFHFNVWGLPGALLGAWLIARTGSRIGLSASAAGLLLGLGALAYCLNDVTDLLRLYVALAVVGTFMSAVQAGLYSLAAYAYPTSCRSGGIGFAGGVGRIGAIASAFAGGAVLSLPGGHQVFVGILAAASLIAAAGILVVDRHSEASARG